MVIVAGLILVLFFWRRRPWSSEGDLSKGKLSIESGNTSGGSDGFSWEVEGRIDSADIEICKHPDGSDWLLGAGSFGKVRHRQHLLRYQQNESPLLNSGPALEQSLLQCEDCFVDTALPAQRCLVLLLDTLLIGARHRHGWRRVLWISKPLWDLKP